MCHVFRYRKKYYSMKDVIRMFSVKKDHILGTALSLNLYNKLVYIAGEKKISISEMIMLSVAMQLSRPGVEIQKKDKTPEQKKVITARVSEGLAKMVDDAAKELGCSKSRYISVALNEGLNYVNLR